ncbi:MAG TPA: DNA cytosine methyltransferase [Phycisphaerae bacterium]|nr:DNA cytosine methyltransferase [Phycisphaerae bacterium]HOI56008.1 DNA cytosine methyltransferase [Phycisphaerae bacterium]
MTTPPTETLLDASTRRTARRPGAVAQEMVVDCFAGAGGASLGIEAAIGRAVDLAINHDEVAIRVHSINHPHTRHIQEDIWQADPREETRGRRVGLAWFSPDCTHFSKAKGGKPRNKKIRGLAWVVVKWAAQVRPRVIIMENVEEFQTWGPLDDQGHPVKSRSGEFFRAFVGALSTGSGPLADELRAELDEYFVGQPPLEAMAEGLGYTVEWRELVAADYGTPTTRKRWFLIARRDGLPVQWPKRTHAPRHKAAGLGLKPWRSAAECIDWSLPCPSIFLTKEEAKAAGVRRPLAEATMRRIAKGLRKFVLDSVEPFIVTCNHGGPEFRGRSPGEPLPTLCASRDAYGLAMPTLIQTGYGERDGQAPRVPGIDKPLGTVVSSGKHAIAAAYVQAIDNQSSPAGIEAATEPLRTVVQENRFCQVCAFLNKYHGDKAGDAGGRSLDPAEPIKTQDTSNRHAVCMAHLAKFRADCCGNDARDPVSTITSGHGSVRPAGAAHALGVVETFLVTNNAGSHSADPTDPLHTVTTGDRHFVCAAWLQKHRGTCRHGQDACEPLATVTGGGTHLSEVRAFLVKYFGTGGQHGDCHEPLATITAKHRLGLVTVHGVDYQIVDIGLRMLQPCELLRAQFGRFADEYVLDGTKAEQVAGIGNSVCPELAELLVKVNYKEALNP